MNFTGQLVTGDFEENTMTFETEGQMVLQAGRYSIEQIEVGNSGKNLGIASVSIPSGLHDRNGQELKMGDTFKYFKHEGYLLDDFTAEVVFENGAFCYKIIEGYAEPYNTAFCEHHELKHDFLDWIEIVK